MKSKKSLFIAVALIMTGLQAGAQQNPEARLDALFSQKNHDVYVTAHRGGDWRNDPENSLQSLKRAAALGVDIVETDLKRTKDGQLVLMHDKTLDRTTTGSGPVSDRSLEEVQRLTLRAGTHHPTSYKIPTFMQELEAAKENNVILDVDTGWDYFPDVLKEVNESHAVGRVIINVNPNTSLEDFEKINGPLPSNVAVMIVVEMKRPDSERIISSYSAHQRTVIQCIFADDRLPFLQHTKDVAHQFPVWMNGLWPEQNGGHGDDRAADQGEMDQSWGWLISHGAKILQTDRPRELVDYLRKKNLTESDTPVQSPGGEVAPSTIQLLSYNGRVEYNVQAWNRRKGAIARVLNESRFDVIAIQEASELMIADYQAALSKDYYVVGERSDGHRGNQGWYEFNPIFYNPERFEKLDAGSIWVGEDPARPGDTLRNSKWHGRVFTWIVLRERATGRRLAIGSVHIHGKQADRAVELVTKTLRAHADGAEIVLMGDFNSTPLTAAYHRLTDPNDLHLVDALSVAQKRSGGDLTIIGPGQSVPKPKSAEGVEEGSKAERIDYVFADQGLTVKSYRVVDSRITGETFASDHFPLFRYDLAADHRKPEPQVGTISAFSSTETLRVTLEQ